MQRVWILTKALYGLIAYNNLAKESGSQNTLMSLPASLPHTPTSPAQPSDWQRLSWDFYFSSLLLFCVMTCQVSLDSRQRGKGFQLEPGVLQCYHQHRSIAMLLSVFQQIWGGAPTACRAQPMRDREGEITVKVSHSGGMDGPGVRNSQ